MIAGGGILAILAAAFILGIAVPTVIGIVILALYFIASGKPHRPHGA